LNAKYVYAVKICICSETRFYVSEGTIQDEGKIKEMKIYVAAEIKYIKLILYYITNVI
jgi:hypothetical protein